MKPSNIFSNFHLRALYHVRKYMDAPTANLLTCSIVGSRLDYCNALFTGISEYNLNRLQRIQNRAARLVLSQHHRTPATPLLRSLHWLPVANRINYKVALTSFKVLSGHQPTYLSSLLTPYCPGRGPRSSDQCFLTVPRSTSALQARSFSIYAPHLWNRLPLSLRSLPFTSPTQTCSSSSYPSLHSFKKGLKTFLFIPHLNLWSGNLLF